MKKINKSQLLIRILISPFILCIMIVTYVIQLCWHFSLFIIYGGELVVFEKDSKRTLIEIYKLLEKINENMKI